MFLKNTTATWNVLDTACALGIKKIVLASSGSLYGGVYSQGEPKYTEFPVDESYDVVSLILLGFSDYCFDIVEIGSMAWYVDYSVHFLSDLGTRRRLRPLQTLFRKHSTRTSIPLFLTGNRNLRLKIRCSRSPRRIFPQKAPLGSH